VAICLLVASSTARGEPPPPPQTDRPPRTDRHGDPLPEGAVARLGTTRFRPGRGYFSSDDSLAFSPDGKLLTTGEWGVVRFWETATGKEIRSVPLPGAVSVLAVVFSPDGKLFAAYVNNVFPLSAPWFPDHAIYVGEVAGGKVLHRLHTEQHGFRRVVFSPGGDMLAAYRTGMLEGPGKETLILWDVHTGKELRQLEDVRGAAFMPDGKRLAVGTKGGVIELLDVSADRLVRRLEGHPASVHLLAVSPDGRTLVSADEGQGGSPGGQQTRTSVRLWDLETGKVRRQWLGHDDAVVSLRYSPDGRTVAVEDAQGSLLLYDVASGKQRQRFAGEQRFAGNRESGRVHVFSPDGKVLLLHDKGGPFREWDIARAEERRRWGGPRSTGPLVYSPDGKVLASRGDDGLVVWDVATGKELHPFEGHRTPLRALAFSPDGRLVASLDRTGGFGIWETKTGKPLLPMSADKPEPVLRFHFSADGTLLSAVGKDATVRVWELAAGVKERQFRIGTKETVRMWELSDFMPPDCCAVYAPAGKTLAVAGAAEPVQVLPRAGLPATAIHLWDLAAGKELRTLRGHQGRVGPLVFSPDGKLLASEGEDWNIRLWDVVTGKELQRFQGREKEPGFFLFSPDSKVFAWSPGEAVHLWDVAARKELRQFPTGRRGEPEGQFVFHRDSNTLAVAGNRAVHFWDLAAGKELRTLAAEKEDEFAGVRLFPSPDGRALASVSMDYKHSRHALFDVATGRRLGDFLYLGDEMLVSPDGKTLVQGNDTLKVLEMLSGEAVGEIPGGHHGHLTALAFSADGKLLTTGGSDGSILVWDWRRAGGLTPAATEKIGARELERAWEDLGGKSAKTAYRGMGTLIAGGDEAAAWLGERLQPVAKRDREAVRRLIAALDDNRFEERARASKELEQLGADAEPILRQALADKLPAEAARRVETLLAGPNIGRFSAATMQKLRAVQALEQIGTAKAREVLAKLARGIPEARLTQEAQDARARLAQGR
jgi:WD40 repeat protein